MKAVIAIGLTCATLCLTGCFTVDAVKQKTGDEHVVVRNYGWKLFNWIPLWCGNANPDATIGFVMFRDDVTPEKIQERFFAYAAERQVECPVYDFNDTIFFEIWGIPVPYVFTYKEITLSGTLK